MQDTAHNVIDLAEVKRVAEKLLALTEAPTRQGGRPCDLGNRTHLEKAVYLYEHRRKRNGYFDGALFSDPAWDILLDLYIAQESGREIAVQSACIGAAVPPTTALRWLKVLEDHKLVKRREDPQDHRRRFIRLTPMAVDALTRYLDEC
jgi:DNA-binding MarR family transcriptional regulator